MRNLFMIVALLIVLSPQTALGGGPHMTGTMFNGRAWNALSDAQRLGYVQGFTDGLNLAERSEKSKSAWEVYYCACTFQEIVTGVTAFYAADPVRSPIPVPRAIKFYADITRGTEPDALEAAVRKELREMSNAAQYTGEKP